MRRRTKIGLIVGSVIVAGLLAAVIWPYAQFALTGRAVMLDGTEYFTVERVEYRPPPDSPDDVLEDDRPQDKNPEFDPDRVDRRPLDGWLVNSSAAVIPLDVPLIKPDVEPWLLRLHPSYAEAAGAAREEVLPSINAIDGKAKQFDDGLVAAFDRASFAGLAGVFESRVDLVRRLSERVGPDGPAAPFLAAGLELAGVEVEASSAGEQARYLAEFEAVPARSKPIGVYTWAPDLRAYFRLMRFFQRPFRPDDPVARSIAEALGADAELLEDYRRAVGFDATLTNPPDEASMDAPLAEGGVEPPRNVALFPMARTPEGELFGRLFPEGLPPDADLMRALIRRVRSGEVDLAPGPGSGWYDHQIHALETLLLPGAGPESENLLLTKSYKKRMMEAFAALVTKRRETHARAAAGVEATSEVPPAEIKPRLRLEPGPTYYLRTARAYAFLADFLAASVGEEALRTLHGLRADGEREADLWTELSTMRDLFYGFHLLSAEDIGMAPDLRDDEPVDRERCEALASSWLEDPWSDPDLAADTRVAVPIYVSPQEGRVALWATLGVRLARLEASYARPPRIRPADEGEGDEASSPEDDPAAGDWREVARYETAPVSYLIPVDAFAEVDYRSFWVPDRDELRALCDAHETEDAIVEAIRRAGEQR